MLDSVVKDMKNTFRGNGGRKGYSKVERLFALSIKDPLKKKNILRFAIECRFDTSMGIFLNKAHVKAEMIKCMESGLHCKAMVGIE